MLRRLLPVSCVVVLISAPALAQSVSERAAWMAKPAAAIASPSAGTREPDAEATGIREVSASPRQLIPLTTKLRYTSLILLPDDEDIMDVVCGDKDFWVITVSQNMAHVKPAKAGAETNLNLVTATGTVYSFLLREGKPDGKPVTVPDLKVYVTAEPSVTMTKRKYYAAAQYDALQGELLAAREQVEAERKRAGEQVATFKRQFPTSLSFTYAPWKNEKPFFVRAIWHDDAFTYIRADAKELPALYEVQDGQPAIVNYQVENGIYVVPKVLEHAYLALGKERFVFSEQR
jgi:type IV secretory pathway VirB9-like protein